MSITFSCPSCGKKLAASDRSAGRRKTCPRCRAAIIVPTAAAPHQPTSAPPTRRKSESEYASLLVRPRNTHRGELIDMTAMVDIVFFLLIFFLVTSMQSIEAVIGLPAPQSEAAADSVQAVPDYTNDPNYVIVTIDADDTVWVEDEEALSEQDLRAKLRAARREDNRDGMLVKGATDATHGTFVTVLDAGADAGMKELLFSVQSVDESAEGG